MNVTTRGRYAIRAVLRLALTEQGTPVSVQRIAESEDISPAYLEQLFVRLSEANLVASSRGPHGGYVLNRDASEISIISVLEAVGEPIGLTPCTEEGSECLFSRADQCTARTVWTETAEQFRNYFAHLTVEKVLQAEGLTPARKVRV